MFPTLVSLHDFQDGFVKFHLQSLTKQIHRYIYYLCIEHNKSIKRNKMTTLDNTQCIWSDRAYFISNHNELACKCQVFIHPWEKIFPVQFNIISHLVIIVFATKEPEGCYKYVSTEQRKTLPHSSARRLLSNQMDARIETEVTSLSPPLGAGDAAIQCADWQMWTYPETILILTIIEFNTFS